MRSLHRIAAILIALGFAVSPVPGRTSPSPFMAILSGGDEVPARDTNGRGEATFLLSSDGSKLSYRLVVANITNVTMSHIHVGPEGSNGPIVALLFGPVSAAGGRVERVLATGTITAANLTGSLAGRPLADLVDEIQSGNTYVNVHTNDGVEPNDTGPGDFPGGEIRGQIR
jgi:hypothetical protein